VPDLNTYLDKLLLGTKPAPTIFNLQKEEGLYDRKTSSSPSPSKPQFKTTPQDVRDIYPQGLPLKAQQADVNSFLDSLLAGIPLRPSEQAVGNKPQVAGYSTPEDLLRPGLKPPGPDAAGFWESLGRQYETPTKAIQTTVPVVSEMLSMMESAPAREALSRLSNDKWDYNQWVVRPHAGSRMTGYEPFPGLKATREGDQRRVTEWFEKKAEEIERQERGLTFGGQVAQGISVLPKYMAEFAITGGFANLGQKAGQRMVLRLFGLLT